MWSTFARSKILFSAAFILLLTTPLLAQTGGTIRGTVFDPLGSPLPAAVVEARAKEGGRSFSATSTSVGAYTLANLPPGSYDLFVLVGGRSHFEQKGVTVQSGGIVSVDARLKDDGQLGA